jgi:hypothetical protein
VLLRWETLVREGLEKHFRTRGERAYCLTLRRRFQDKQSTKDVVPLVQHALVYDLFIMW